MGHLTSASRLMLVGVLAVLGSAVALGADEGDNLLLNPGAEQGKGELPSVWFAARVPAEGLRMWRSTERPHAGKFCLAISNSHQYEKPTANNWAQPLREVPAGRTVRLSAYIRTKDADSANVCVQCWDLEGRNMLAFGSTPVFRGDQDWILARSQPIVVPQSSAFVIVRAAVGGTGKAWFDEISLTVVPTRARARPGEVKIPSPRKTGLKKEAVLEPKEGADKLSLSQLLGAQIVQALPIEKDCMVLAYLPSWAYGNLDNIGVANNDGGVRTLLQWPTITTMEARRSDRRFVLALYSRKTTRKPPAGKVEAYEVLAEWPEITSWKTLPPTAKEAAASFPFVPGVGWKLFDITPLVRLQADAKRKARGAMLRFASEDRSGEKADWSGYQFVSREGMGEWAGLRPRLLVVEPSEEHSPPGSQTPVGRSAPAE